MAKLYEGGIVDPMELNKAKPKWKRRTRKRWIKGNIESLIAYAKYVIKCKRLIDV
ncbi:MAG: hypothetical protein ACOX54_10595 [Christensenellales bacterium]